MQAFQTVGKTHYPGLVLNIVVRDNLEISSEIDQELMQLMYIDQGTIMVHKPDQVLKLNPPILLCLNHTEPADHVTMEGTTGFSILFKPDVVNHSLGAPEKGPSVDRSWDLNQVLIEPFRLSRRENPVYLNADLHLQRRILSIRDNLCTQLVQQPDTSWPCRGRSFFLELMVILQSFWGQQGEDDRGFPLPRGNPLVEKAAREACIDYPNPKLSLRTIAETLKVPFRELEKPFTTLAGETFPSFLGRLRISVAANLVRNTILDPDTIFRRCGYRSRFGMNWAFRKTYGIGPTEYRAQHPDPYG